MQKVKRILIMLLYLYIGLMLISTKVYAKTATATSETVRIRKEASTDSGIVTLVSQGEEVEILEEQGEWYKVNYKTYTGYIRKDMLSVNEENNETKEENTTTTSSSDDKQNTTANEANVNEETKQEDNTTSIEENEQNESNTETSSKQQTLNVENNNELKSGEKLKLISNVEIKILPSINSSIIGTLNENTEVTVIDIINKWCHIENEEKSGWVLISKLKSENIGNALTTENNETTNQEENETNNETSSETQIPSEEQENTQSQSNEEKSITKYVSTETLNVRKKPDNSAEIIDHLALNTEVTIIENVDNTWAKVKVKQIEGYVASKYLSDTKTEVTSRSEDVVRESPNQENVNNASQEVTTTGKLGQDIVTYAKQYLGYKYVSGGSSPDTGFDCSGFTCYVYKHFGITLNRTSSAQNSNGTGIAKENLQPGDLLIFNNSSNSGIGHVGIYMGDNNFIHAANGSKGVVTTSLTNSYYVTRYVGARRVIN